MEFVVNYPASPPFFMTETSYISSIASSRSDHIRLRMDTGDRGSEQDAVFSHKILLIIEEHTSVIGVCCVCQFTVIP